MATELDPLLVDKLAIARELLARASSASTESNILGPALGISLAQDALELILRGIANHHGVKLGPRPPLEEVIKGIEKTTVNGALLNVPHQNRIAEINQTRVNFKHNGMIPDAKQARKIVAFAPTIGDDICRECLGVSIWEATAVRLVKKTRVRNHLSAALQHQANGDFEASCLNSGIAFALVFGGVENQRFRHSRALGENIGGYDSYGSSNRPTSREETASLARAIREDFSVVADLVNSLQRQIDLLKLGINLDALRRFETILPDISEWHGRITVASRGRRTFTSEDSTFCVQFALDSILKGQGDIGEPGPIEEYVEVLEETPILASFPKLNRPAEVIAIAAPGERFPLSRSGNLGGEVVEILFEGDRCYIASVNTKIIPA